MAVIGLARSGRAAAELLARRGRRVYASDAGDSPGLRAAAEQLRALNVDVQLGGHDLRRLETAAMLVVSPGIRPDAAPVLAARQAGVPVRSEVAVALEALPGTRVIAVTGTNGKSTTTALIAHLLAGTGRPAVAAGNIGLAVAEVALRDAPPDWIALEISSFQLHDTPHLGPLVGVLTNLAPDHLDRYVSVADYYADKRRLFDGASAGSHWVTNADDPDAQRLCAGVPGTHVRFSLNGEAEAKYLASDGGLFLFGTRLCDRNELRLLGTHNVANALAAVLAVAVAAGDPRQPELARGLAAALRSFRGLPHRLEIVGESGGVLWINDSKATNVASARVAVAAMERPTVLLLGGRHKGESYRSLLPAIGTRVRHVIAYGEAAPVVERDLRDAVTVERLGSDFEQAVAAARRAARPGDAVLLAPACASFDMFADFEERGATFRNLAGVE